jgi:hypothetical protein
MRNPTRLKIFMAVILALLGTFNLGYALYALINISDSGLIDFCFYWYSGLFIRQGVNPYQGFLQNLPLSFPISLIGGNITSQGLILSHPGTLLGLPMNTVPFILLIAPFSFLSLKTATMIWTVLNIILAFLIPLLIIRYLQRINLLVPKYFYPLSVIIFFTLSTTSRGVIARGQNTLFIYFLMLLALLVAENRKFLFAGILLGLALSKYTVALPMLAFFIIKKNWKVIFIAIAVQILGFVALAWLTRSSLPSTLLSYWSIISFHLTDSNRYLGINISDYLPSGILFPVLSFFVTTIPIGVLIYCVMKKSAKFKSENNLLDGGLISVLLLWILLAINNSGYDAILTIFPFLPFAEIMENSQNLGLNKKNSRLAICLPFLDLYLIKHSEQCS